MITQKDIRTEKFGNAKFALSDHLDQIALTKDQRQSIDSYVGDMEDLFDQANQLTKD